MRNYSVWSHSVSTKKMVRIRNFILGVLLAIGLCGYILAFVGHWGVAGHMQVLVAGKMQTVYVGLCKCLAKKGQWPPSLMEAVKCPEAELSERSALDPITERPLLYYSDAKPGTKAILIAQPEARQNGSMAIRQNGTTGRPGRWNVC